MKLEELEAIFGTENLGSVKYAINRESGVCNGIHISVDAISFIEAARTYMPKLIAVCKAARHALRDVGQVYKVEQALDDLESQ